MSGDRVNDVSGTSIAMLILSISAVVFRLHARAVKKVPLGIDDWLILTALLFTVAFCIVVLVAVYEGGLGSHLVFLDIGIPADVDAFMTFGKMLWVTQFLTPLSLGFTKLSVLFFYKRIFVGNTFQLLCWVTIGLSAAWTIAFFFANFLDCLPFELNWRRTANVSGHCVDIIALFWGISISDILIDALILCLPWGQIWKLQMSTTQKVQIAAIFTLGWLTVGAGIARTVLSLGGVSSGTTDLDYTYSRAPAVYWTVIQCCIGVVSACMPTFRPLFSHYKLNTAASSLRGLLSSRKQKDSLSSGNSSGIKRSAGSAGSQNAEKEHNYSVTVSNYGKSPRENSLHASRIEVRRELRQTYNRV